MNLTKVDWEYQKGLKALLNLTNMLEAAIEEVNDIKLKKTGGWHWRGYYIDNVFCGIRFDKPLIIVFENNMGTNPTFKEELDLEAVHFLAFSNEEQFECLINFIKETTEKYLNFNIENPSPNPPESLEETNRP